MFEERNETFYYDFHKSKGIETLINSCYYICIKKAFTPYAAMTMLK